MNAVFPSLTTLATPLLVGEFVIGRTARRSPPEAAGVLAELAEGALDAARLGTAWVPLEVTKATANNLNKLTKLPDGSYLASGPAAKTRPTDWPIF